MATVLYRLGRAAFARRGLVVLAWVVVLGALGAGAATLSGPTSNSFSIPGTESQRALDLLSQRTGAPADTAQARVVFTAGDATSFADPGTKKVVEDVVSRLSALPRVTSVVDPFQAGAVSPDGSTAFATVTYAVRSTDLSDADQSALFDVARDVPSDMVTVTFGGEAAQEQFATSATEGLGLVVAALVLLLTFGSVIAAGMPLLTAVAGVGVGLLGIMIISGFTALSSTTPTLALMLGLAVGIDYALLIVSRYRHEVLAGHQREDAVGRAVGTAGSAVVFAGATVVIALMALSVVGIPFLTEMGLAAAATVMCSVLIALTLLPALLGFAGDRVLGRRGLRARDTEAESPADDTAGPAGRTGPAAIRATFGERWVRGVLRHRVIVLVVVVVGLGVIALPALDLRLGLPSDATAPQDSTQRQAYDALAAGFGPGVNGPLVIVADLAGTPDPASATATIGADLAGVPGVAAVTPPVLTPDGATAIYTMIPRSGPDDVATEVLVHTVRSRAAGWQSVTGAQVHVTGNTAVGIDVSQKLSGALLPYLAVVVGLAFLLLMLVFRSIVVPLKAALGFLLSVAVAFGAVVVVFQKGWGADLLGVTPGPVLSFLPILLVGILFGLAMDYEVFLVTRMREEHVHGARGDDAVVAGFRHSARVVSAAAVIMVSVFAGFVTGHEAVIKSIGFGLAIGVFVDAFLVRMTVVPAVMSLLGDRAWWLPRWLDRALPNVDIEGERLAAVLGTATHSTAPADLADEDRAGAGGPTI